MGGGRWWRWGAWWWEGDGLAPMTDRDKVDAIKVIIKQAFELHAPKDERRDPRWTRVINAIYAGVVRVAGPFQGR